MARARFAGVVFRRDHLVLGFWLKRRISSARLKVQYLGRSDWVYELPIRSLEELDDEVRGWLGEAYLVGRQEWRPKAATAGRGARTVAGSRSGE